MKNLWNKVVKLWDKLVKWWKGPTYVKHSLVDNNVSYKIQLNDDDNIRVATLLYMISSPFYIYKMINDSNMAQKDKQEITDLYNAMVAVEVGFSQKPVNTPVIKPSEVYKNLQHHQGQA